MPPPHAARRQRARLVNKARAAPRRRRAPLSAAHGPQVMAREAWQWRAMAAKAAKLRVVWARKGALVCVLRLGLVGAGCHLIAARPGSGRPRQSPRAGLLLGRVARRPSCAWKGAGLLFPVLCEAAGISRHQQASSLLGFSRARGVAVSVINRAVVSSAARGP
jgi:hypothetical protein